MRVPACFRGKGARALLAATVVAGLLCSTSTADAQWRARRGGAVYSYPSYSSNYGYSTYSYPSYSSSYYSSGYSYPSYYSSPSYYGGNVVTSSYYSPSYSSGVITSATVRLMSSS